MYRPPRRGYNRKVRSLLLPVLLAGACAAPASRAETVEVPGTSVRVGLRRVDGGLPRPFWIADRPVTWGEFDRFAEVPEDEETDGVTRPSTAKSYLMMSGLPPEHARPERPLTNVRRLSAVAWCEWLSKRTGMVFRLPTETEWEAARIDPGGRWEHCLEPFDPPTPGAVLRSAAGRHGIPGAWFAADPSRPVSSWWFRAGHHQGFRVVRVAGADTRAQREAYAGKIGLRILRHREIDAPRGLHVRVEGTVTNRGARTLRELALKVYYLTPEGRPHPADLRADTSRHATFADCYPVLVNSAHPGPHARPLGPGESRPFTADVPMSFDDGPLVRSDAFGASVLHLAWSR